MKHYVCDYTKSEEKKPYFVKIEEMTIGIIRVNDQVYAIENRCPHFEGPVCLGEIMGRIRTQLNENMATAGDYLLADYASEDELNLICPWHGFEFDLVSGKCIADPKFRLRKFKIEIQDEKVYIHI